MKLRQLAAGLLLLWMCSTASAFEEKPMPGVGKAPAAVPSTSVPSGQGLGLATPDAPSSKSESGTKIKIPGLGIIGEIPKLDLKLELLYGASEPKQQLNGDRDVEASGVMGRVRVPLKSP